jgi:hypothetical protein
VIAAVSGVSLCPAIIGCSALSSVGGAVAGDAASSVFSALGSWLASGAQGLVDHVLTLITTPTGSASAAASSAGGAAASGVALVSSGSATEPSLGVTWFAQQETLMLELMGLVMLPILLISTIGAIVRQDLARLARTWLMALPLALICGFVGVELTKSGIDLTDALSSAVLSGVNLSKTMGAAITDTAITGAAGGAVAPMVIACLAIVAGLLLWLELVLRTAAVYIALLFLPLAMAGLVWPTTTRMAKRLVEMLVALILSKFVVASVLALGANAVSGGGEDGALTGAAMLLLAGFAPFVLFRMVPIIEAGAIGHLEGVSRRPLQAPIRAAQTVRGLGGLGLGGRSGDGSSLSSSRVGEQNIGERQGEYSPAAAARGAASGGDASAGGAAIPGGGSGGAAPSGGGGLGTGGSGASPGGGGAGGGPANTSAGAATRSSRRRAEPRPPGPVAPTVAGEPPSPPDPGAYAGISAGSMEGGEPR